MTNPALADNVRWLHDGTEFILERVDIADLSAPSLLPGWTNAHVAAHVSRNADAVGRLLTWARTGIETPMYPSPADRVAEIERDARRPDDVQRADVRLTAYEFVRAVDTLEAEAWSVQVRTARDRVIPAAEVPWMRVKEVWLHAVDIGAPISGLPADLVHAPADRCGRRVRRQGGRPGPAIDRARADLDHRRREREGIRIAGIVAQLARRAQFGPRSCR